jgi:hypothetical protein
MSPTRLLCARPWVNLALLVALSAIAALGARQMPWRYELEDFFPTDTPERRAFDRLRTLFGRDDGTALIIVEKPTPLDLTDFAPLRALAHRMTQLPEVASVLSPTDARIVVAKTDGSLALERALPRSADAERLGLARAALARPPYQDFLLSRDGCIAVIAVTLRDDALDVAHRERFLSTSTEEAAALAAARPWRVRLGGYPVQRTQFAQAAAADTRTLAPWVLLALLLVLIVGLRSVLGVLAPLASAAVAATWTAGIFAAIGIFPNLLAAACFVLVTIVAVSHSVHLVARYGAILAEQPDRRLALERTLGEVVRPCLLNSVTTAVGFVALNLADIPMIRTFGQQVAIGVMVAYLAAMLVTPTLLALDARLRPARGMAGRRTFSLEPLLAALAHRVSVRPWTVLVLAASLMATGVIGTTIIRVNSPLLADLDPSHPVRETNRLLEERMGGVIALNLVLDPAATGATPLAPRHLEQAALLAEKLRRLPDVFTVVSAVDIARAFAPAVAGRLLGDAETLATLPALIELAAEDLSPWVHAQTGTLRMRLTVKNLDTDEAIALFAEIRALYQETFGVPAGNALTGQGYIVQVLNEQIVEQFSGSFLATVLTVFFILLLGLRDVRLAAAAILPNVFPVILVTGMMGFTGIELRYSSALVLSVVFGLVVDDTAHFLTHVKMGRVSGDPIGYTLRVAGPGVLLTSFVLLAGFGVLCASTFVPNRVMGILLAATVIFGRLGDLVVLPAQLVAFRWAKPSAPPPR